MKVIQTNQPETWSRPVVCRQCLSVLEVEEADVKFINTAVGYAGETWEPELYVECPICHVHNNMTWLVPNHLRQKLFDENR